MKLDRYCAGRLVVLRASASAYEAARAMDANRVGAVLVTERGQLSGIVTDRDLAMRALTSEVAPRRLVLRDVMTPHVARLSVHRAPEAAAEQMAREGVRRLAVMRGDTPVGIVTLDDLIISGGVHPNHLKDVVLGQLSVGAKLKPEGLVRPTRVRPHPDRADRTRRRRERRAQTLRAFTTELKQLTGLARGEDALAAFEVVASALVSRLMPEEADDFCAQLPGALREKLRAGPRGPDRSVTRRTLLRDVEGRLRLDARRSEEVVVRLCGGMGRLISKGELADVVGQLPRDLKPLFSHAA